MWDLPGPGLKPVSPALAGGFLTTAPPGKPHVAVFKCVAVPMTRVAGHVAVHEGVLVTLAPVGLGPHVNLRDIQRVHL